LRVVSSGRGAGLCALVLVASAAACPNIPPAEQLSVKGKMERDGVEATDLQDVGVDYASKSSRGEWWSCELRLTAGACVGDAHVNVWLALPSATSFDQLGGNACVDADGNPFGVFELLTDKLAHGEPVEVPGDVQVLTLIASDKDGDGSADLENDDETTAASRMLEGLVEIQSLGSFDDPVALTASGITDGDSLQLDIAMNGPTAPVPTPGKLDVARTCVAKDAL
jgi:hypothetical protein